jgi:error-prone DNA polymerase
MAKGLANSHAAAILAAREQPFESIEEVWKSSGVPIAALERIAEADGFASLGIDRRQALWRVKALGEKPLPLFAAADAREEDREPVVALQPLSEGREVVEDYRSTQLSLRAHPLSFLRPQLDSMKVVRCSDLKRIKDGRRIDVSGIVLIRQRPGSTSVTFLTIEDESGVANIIIWPKLFEEQRRVIMTASMMNIRGMVQREGDVIHVIAERLEDRTSMLHSIGNAPFKHRRSPADGATNGGRDPREQLVAKARDDYSAPCDIRTGEEPIRVRSRNFH